MKGLLSSRTPSVICESRPSQRLDRLLFRLVLTVAVLSGGLAVDPTPAAADHIESVSNDVKKDSHQLRRYGGSWYRGEGGGTGSNGFYYTYDNSSYGYWYFGNLRGVYRAELFYPDRDAVKWDSCDWRNRNCRMRPPTASPRFLIQQKNTSGRWSTIYDLKDKIYANGEYKTGWKGWDSRIELDGSIRVKVQKRYGDDKYRLAADSFQFKWRDLLPEDKKIAISLCQAQAIDEVIQQKGVIAWVKFVRGVAEIALTVSVTYLTGFATATALPAAVARAAQAVGALKNLRNAAQLSSMLTKLSSAIRAVQQIPRAADLVRNGMEITQQGLLFAIHAIELTDDIAKTGILGEHEHLYDDYKSWCKHRDGTLVDWSAGKPDWFFGNGPGGGCSYLDRWTCVSGYLDHVARWHP